MPPLDTQTQTLLARMLRRLPASLWDGDPASETLQRDLYGACATLIALWLENRDIARRMSLLREAQGRDLDVLMEDYGLRRYLQRPDDVARQIAQQILFRPRGTMFSVDHLADLLFDPPHLTLRTGRGQAHVLIADTHPITLPWSYWGLVSQDGIWYALTVEGEVPLISQAPPPGRNVAPGPQTLHWITALDASSGLWYVTIAHDTLYVSQTLPGGTGTLDPVAVLDGRGTSWGLTVDAPTQTLVSTPLATNQPPLTVLTPNHPFQTFQLVDSALTPWWVSIQAGSLALTATAPPGTINVTPAGGPYRWWRATDLAGTLWYVFPTTLGVLQMETTTPGGAGTKAPQALGDADGVLWHVGMDRSGSFAISETPKVHFGGMATALCLTDAAGQPWFWRVHDGHLQWSPVLWPDTLDQSPWGALGWLEVTSTTGVPLVVYPSLAGNPTAAIAPPTTSRWGWPEPVLLWDAQGQPWQLTVNPTVIGQPEYWQMVTTEGETVALWVEGEVPTITATAPLGGVDTTPGTPPLAWFTAVDAQGGPWAVVLEDDTLVPQSTLPASAGTTTPCELQDLRGQVWLVQLHRPDVLYTLPTATTWRVRVAAAPVPDIPPLDGALDLRDATEALHHVQAAGSLVTVRVT